MHEPATYTYVLVVLLAAACILLIERACARDSAVCCRRSIDGEEAEHIDCVEASAVVDSARGGTIGRVTVVPSPLLPVENSLVSPTAIELGKPTTSGTGSSVGSVNVNANAHVQANQLPSFPPGRCFVSLQFDSLDFHIGRTRVLKGLAAGVKQGELTALMGESGSGKTSLLNVLSGRASYGTVSGTLTLNGLPHEPLAMRHLIAFVPQEYQIHRDLTVQENLLHAARLRLPARTTEAVRTQLVEEVLALLRMTEWRNFVCGAGAHRLSGGQLRRVSIGVELVACPSIIFLDEPTSGLDAANSKLVIAALKALCARGVLAVAALHQPRYAAYELCSRMLLLHRGEMIYGGTRTDALPYFEQLGFGLPEHANPADFFIEVTFGHVQSDANPSILHAELPIRWRTSSHTHAARAPFDAGAGVGGAGAEGSGVGVTREVWTEWFVGGAGCGVQMDRALCTAIYEEAQAVGATAGTALPTWIMLHGAVLACKLPPNGHPNWGAQLLVCFSRYILKRFLTRRRYYGACAVMAVAGLVCGLMIGTRTRMWDIILTYTVANSLFCACFASAAIASFGDRQERDLCTHEAISGVQISAEAVGRLAADMLLLAPLPLLFAFPLQSFTNFSGGLPTLLAIFYAAAWSVSPIGYCCAVLAPGNATILTSALALLTSLLLCGLFGFVLAELPPVGVALLALSPGRWLAQALLRTRT